MYFNNQKTIWKKKCLIYWKEWKWCTDSFTLYIIISHKVSFHTPPFWWTCCTWRGSRAGITWTGGQREKQTCYSGYRRWERSNLYTPTQLSSFKFNVTVYSLVLAMNDIFDSLMWELLPFLSCIFTWNWSQLPVKVLQNLCEGVGKGEAGGGGVWEKNIHT